MTVLSSVLYYYAWICSYFVTFDLPYRRPDPPLVAATHVCPCRRGGNEAAETIFNCLLYKSHFCRTIHSNYATLMHNQKGIFSGTSRWRAPICVYVLVIVERVWMWRMWNVGVCCVTKCTLSQICRGSLAGGGGPHWPLLCQPPIV